MPAPRRKAPPSHERFRLIKRSFSPSNHKDFKRLIHFKNTLFLRLLLQLNTTNLFGFVALIIYFSKLFAHQRWLERQLTPDGAAALRESKRRRRRRRSRCWNYLHHFGGSDLASGDDHNEAEEEEERESCSRSR